MRAGGQRLATRSEPRHLGPSAVRPQKKSIACYRCHSQKIKCSGEKPCLRCRRAGYAAQCGYANRDRKIRVDESYLEQLIQDSQELREQRARENERAHHTTDDTTAQPAETPVTNFYDHAVSETPWFQSQDTSVLPIYINEAACTAFATRLCQCLRGTDASILRIPQYRYTSESTLTSLLQVDVQWPSLVHATLLVKTALCHINPSFHLTLKGETMNSLQDVYRTADFNNPTLQCKYFALFAIGQVYSTPYNSINASAVSGSTYFAHAMSVIRFVPERPSLIHIECLLLLAYFCQFLNRFHSAYLLVGNALRLGLSLGLNYNVPKNQRLPTVEREHRVRIWWSIYVLDRFWGSKSGFPVQIHDDDIHVDLPSSLVSETCGEQFAASSYQVAAIALAKITGNTTREIYSRRKYTESFLQREQKLLIQLKRWVQSLPEDIRLHADKVNAKDTLLLHLQFNYCVILAIRPVLLNLLIGHTKSHRIYSTGDVTPILAALCEACIHAARYSLKLCVDEFTNGSIASFGYAFPAFIFSSALVLVVSSILPFGSVDDLPSVDTAIEMLNILSASDNLPAKDLHEHLQRVRQCLQHHQSNLTSPVIEKGCNDIGNPSSMPNQLLQLPLQSGTCPSLDQLSLNLAAPGSSVIDFARSSLTTEMALQNPLMQEFMEQSSMDIGLINPPEIQNDSDFAFLWCADALDTE
ncbi:fungal-specific transcription factor domain-containing protein [Aspergillus pseudocaelatus]|uniref:Fungal-specific transcription factor domain-containing protein n=1 Tax=Aspergillus pseudocaelatus TaxID=1825620 RepID=A0ABQ6WLZ0_9EURO|nr:fungal-specific transcription factor domain-containing protein [Aspergillus pseudocaelatus]